MAERDHRVRVILEGLDKLSGVARGAAQKFDQEIEKIKKSSAGLRKENDELDRTFRRTEATMNRQGGLFAQARKGAEDLAASVAGVRKETDKLAASAQKVKQGGFLSGVRSGLGAANEERSRVSARFAQTKEEFDKNKKLIQAEFEQRIIDIDAEHKKTVQGIKQESAERLIGIRKAGAEALRDTLERARIEAAQFEESIGKRNAAVKAENDQRLELITRSNEKVLAAEQQRADKRRAGLDKELAKEAAALSKEIQTRQDALKDEEFRRRQILTTEIAQLRDQRDKEKDAVKSAVFQTEINAKEEAARKEREQGRRDLAEEIKIKEEAQKKEHAQRLADLDTENASAIDKQKEKNRLELLTVDQKNAAELAAARERNDEDSKAAKRLIAERQNAQEAENRSKIAGENAAREIKLNAESVRAQEERKNNRTLRAAANDRNASPNIGAIFAEERKFTNKLRDAENGFKKMGFAAGRAFGDISSGFRIAKKGFRTLEDGAVQSAGIFQKFGFAVGKVVANFGDFVNLRWLVITGFLASFLSLILQAGVAVVALASSLALAGAALGGAFLAGLSQALPVAGLFAAAMTRVKAVLAAVKLSDAASLRSSRDARAAMEARVQAAQRLTDAHHALLNALNGVKEADFSLSQASKAITDAQDRRVKAVKELNDARRKAARDIQDANLAEKKSAIDLADAELAVVDAKRKLREEELKKRQAGADIGDAQAAVKEANRRLAIARQEGDQAQISQAAQAVSLAKQNLDDVQTQADQIKNNVAQAKVDVQKSTLAVEKAKIDKRRSIQDAAQARTKGVEGSDVVIAAQKELRDSTRGITEARHTQAQAVRAVAEAHRAVAIARREENDARRATKDPNLGKTAAQSTLEETKARLSKSELGLFNAVVRIKKLFKKEFGPITDIIIQSFAGAVNAVSTLLKDPAIINAATGLARAIADAVGKVSKFVISPAFRKDLVFFITQAKNNLPTVASILGNIFKIFVSLAKAAAPLFKHLLEGFKGLTDKGAKAASNQQRLTKFFESAGKHLKSWLEFGKAVGRVLFFLAGGAAPSGKGLLDSFTSKLNEIANWLRDNPAKVHKFFDRMADQIRKTAGELGKLAKLLVNALSSKEFANLATTFTEILIPGLVTFLGVLGKVSGGLLAILNVPVVGDLVKLALTIGITERAFNKIFPATQHLTDAFKKLGILGFKKAAYELRFLMLMLAESAFGQTLIKAAKAVVLFSRTTAAALLTNPWVIAIVAVIAAIVLLDRKFHFIRPTIEALGRAFRFVFNWIKDHWKLLLVILTGPFGLAILTIRRHFNDIKKFAQAALDFFKDHWKGIIQILAGPFGITLKLIMDHFEGIKKVFTGVLSFLKGAFKTAGTEIYKLFIKPFVDVNNFIIDMFKKLPGIIKNILKGIPGLVTGLIKSIPGGSRFLKILGGAKDAAGAVKGAVGKAASVAADQTGVTDSKRASARDILDADKQYHGAAIDRLRAAGLDDDAILKRLFNRKILTLARIRSLAAGKDVKPLLHSLGVKGFMEGGEAGGIGRTDTVPAMLTPGEWVLNRSQQDKLARKFGESAQQLKAFLFGTSTGSKAPHTNPSKTEAPFYGKTFNLVPQTDDNGKSVYFLEFDDGTFGQVTSRDAKRIVSSKGNFIPSYAKRNSHGFSQNRIGAIEGRRMGFAMGGVVPKGFARGGIVSRPATMGGPGGKTINQDFQVYPQGDTDWHAVMRLGALHAQESF